MAFGMIQDVFQTVLVLDRTPGLNIHKSSGGMR